MTTTIDNSLHVRLSLPNDLEPLVLLEQAAFSADQFTKSLITSLLTKDRASVLVAEKSGHICGAAYMIWNRNTRKGRLLNLAVHPEFQSRGIGQLLMAECETETVWRGHEYLTLEVREDNHKGRKFYEKLGYLQDKRVPRFYDDGSAAIQMSKALRSIPPHVHTQVPYYSQTTPFSCGTACLMMALGHFKPEISCGRTLEMNLWKVATLIFTASGIGGTDPYGLALAAVREGLSARVLSSNDKNPFTLSVRNPRKREVINLLHEDMKAEAQRKNIAATSYPFDLTDIISYLYRGWLPIILISTYRLTGFRGLHWVLVTGYDEKSVYVHDPDSNSYEKNRELAINLPISHKEFKQLLHCGKSQNRFAVFTGPPSANMGTSYLFI
ncbi:MAG: peptidase C39 family protein [Candidatus Scalindua sp.]|nr:peptidase C39 family protein [Candidatus Scalindua sp.]